MNPNLEHTDVVCGWNWSFYIFLHCDLLNTTVLPKCVCYQHHIKRNTHQWVQTTPLFTYISQVSSQTAVSLTNEWTNSLMFCASDSSKHETRGTDCEASGTAGAYTRGLYEGYVQSLFQFNVFFSLKYLLSNASSSRVIRFQQMCNSWTNNVCSMCSCRTFGEGLRYKDPRRFRTSLTVLHLFEGLHGVKPEIWQRFLIIIFNSTIVYNRH